MGAVWVRGGADGGGWVAEVDGFFCILDLRVEVENRLFDFITPSLKQLYKTHCKYTAF